jgi:phage gpG-like protein
MLTLRTNLRPEEIRQLIELLPEVAAGRAWPAEARAVQTVIGLAALNQIKRAFLAKSRGGADETGARWAPLAASTVARRRKGRRRGGTIEILRDTGRLFNSLGPALAVQPGPGSVMIGTNDPKAAWHHYGTPRMPARPLWPDPKNWPDLWYERIAAAARDALLSLLRRALGAF